MFRAFILFDSVEAIRWLEWGTKSYGPFMYEITLVLFGILIGSTSKIPRPIGYLMGLYGVTYFWSGWIVGTEGFYPPALGIPAMSAPIINIAMIVWLLILAWRKQVAIQAAPA
jgi:hypothetical protein